MADMMTFPNTVEEFMEQYKITDTEQIYTNGTELVPIFRMKQWFDHKPEQQWIPCSERLLGDDEYAEVLCCDTHKNYIIGYPFADPASETGYSAESDGVYMCDCIAWMPLPESYRGEKNV